ncbi:MAG: LysR family transcriptional regulator [Alicyclobacillus sp.]|nr:LysR family transcriptional regulator [Alicyclobacillus sp.]
MNWEDVHIFLTVAEMCSMTRASQRLHLSQSAISKRIQQLESELQTTLFTRGPAGVRLTPAGRAFLPYAQQSLQWLTSGILSSRQHEELAHTFKFGVTVALASMLAPVLVHCFGRQTLNYRFETVTSDSEKIMPLVCSGVLHAGLVSTTADTFWEGVRVRRVAQQSYYLIGTEDALAPLLQAGPAMEPEALGRLRYVVPNPGVSLRRLIDGFFQKIGVSQPRLLAETDNLEVLRMLVQQGVACTLYACPIASVGAPLLHIPLNEWFPQRYVDFLISPDVPARLGSFLEMVYAYLQFHWASAAQPAELRAYARTLQGLS